MPNRDGTGPNGKGKLTGRGLGKCEGKKPLRRGQGWRHADNVKNE